MHSGNTRLIGQKELQDFRESLGSKVNDAYQVLLRQNKLPMSLLNDAVKVGWLSLILVMAIKLCFDDPFVYSNYIRISRYLACIC